MRGRPTMMLAGRGVRPETKALVARMTVAPSRSRQLAINRLIGRLIAAGLWQHAAFDGFYVFAAHDAQAARLNWFAANAASAVSSPTFTVDQGYAGDGAAAYLTGATTTGNIADHHIGLFVQQGTVSSDLTSNGSGWMLAAATTLGSGSGVAADDDYTSTTGLRYAAISRAASASYRQYRNGSLLATKTREVDSYQTGVAARALWANFNYQSGRIAAWHYGQALTDQQVADLYAALDPYMIEVGAA